RRALLRPHGLFRRGVEHPLHLPTWLPLAKPPYGFINARRRHEERTRERVGPPFDQLLRVRVCADPDRRRRLEQGMSVTMRDGEALTYRVVSCVDHDGRTHGGMCHEHP